MYFNKKPFLGDLVACPPLLKILKITVLGSALPAIYHDNFVSCDHVIFPDNRQIFF
jgi:hypothetical protein